MKYIVLLIRIKLSLLNRVQLTTDAHRAYLDAVEGAFDDNIDYAMLVKLYGATTGESQTERKYSCAECNGQPREPLQANQKKSLSPQATLKDKT